MIAQNSAPEVTLPYPQEPWRELAVSGTRRDGGRREKAIAAEAGAGRRAGGGAVLGVVVVDGESS